MLCEIMGIVFIMFAELEELWVQIFNQNGTTPSKIRLSLPPEGSSNMEK